MKQQDRFSVLAVFWIIAMALEFFTPARKGNRVITLCSVGYRLLKRVVLLILLIVNVFMTIGLLDNKGE